MQVPAVKNDLLTADAPAARACAAGSLGVIAQAAALLPLSALLSALQSPPAPGTPPARPTSYREASQSGEAENPLLPIQTRMTWQARIRSCE